MTTYIQTPLLFKQIASVAIPKYNTNPNVVHQHLVETNRSEGALDDVGDRCCSHDCEDTRKLLLDARLKKHETPFNIYFSHYSVLSFNSVGRTVS